MKGITNVLASLALVVAAAVVGSSAARSSPYIDTRPVLGILALPNEENFPGDMYFPASYVKWIESGGARVVPIKYTDDEATLRNLLSQLNGFLFTGGGASFVNPDGTLTEFSKAAQMIFNEVVSAAEQGETVPLWGTCLGFQLINFLASGPDPNILTSGFDSENLTLPLDPTTAWKGSFFQQQAAAANADTILLSQNVTLNAHHSGVTPSDWYRNKNLTATFTMPLATNKDRNGKEFVSVVEGTHAPIFATQYHPEKALFEWRANEVIPHWPDAVIANSWPARMLVAEAMKNDRHFASEDDLEAALIYNYQPVYTAKGQPDANFQQCYFFNA